MNEHKIGDLVIHCREGLAKIMSITKISDKDYFIINTISGSGDNIYVPIDNSQSIIRQVMSKEEAVELIKYMKSIEPDFITNTKQRRDKYKHHLNGGNVYDYAYLSKQLYLYENNQFDQSIKLGSADIDMLKYADRIIKDELAISYSTDKNGINKIYFDEFK